MVPPGEVAHEIGRAYQYVLVGALSKVIPGFQPTFYVQETSEKTSFHGNDGKSFSFDFSGLYRHPLGTREVFGECKGYGIGSSLLDAYREFIAKSFVTSRDNRRHSNDLFWFVTNVPFGCNEGRGLVERNFLQTALCDSKNQRVRDIVGSGDIDPDLVKSLAKRIGAFILTDSFLVRTPILYRVQSGETLWSILKLIHGGRVPVDFGIVAEAIAYQNNLKSKDHIESGQTLALQWMGMQGTH